MPKKVVQDKLVTGYSPWPKRYTIDQAKNVARWNPWLAHEWMNEASRSLSIEDYILIEYHDKIADQINTDWRNRTKYHFHNQKEFWNGLPPKMIPKIISDDEYDVIENEEEQIN